MDNTLFYGELGKKTAAIKVVRGTGNRSPREALSVTFSVIARARAVAHKRVAAPFLIFRLLIFVARAVCDPFLTIFLI